MPSRKRTTPKPRGRPPSTRLITQLINQHLLLAVRPCPIATRKATESLAKWSVVWVDRSYKGDPLQYLDWHIKTDLGEVTNALHSP